jgi:hypothetical protein
MGLGIEVEIGMSGLAVHVCPREPSNLLKISMSRNARWL